MATFGNEKEVKALFSRVYDNKMVCNEEQNDEKDLVELMTKVFGEGEMSLDPSALHQFNNLLIKKADEIAQPRITDIVGLLSSTKTVKRGDTTKYTIDTKLKAKLAWTAMGSGVDYVRVEGQKSYTPSAKTFSTGFYYEILDPSQDAIGNFKKLVNNIADAKIKLIMDKITEVIAAAIVSNVIPAKNRAVGTNLTIAQYNGVASVLARFGGRPIFIADTLLVDHFVEKVVGDTHMSALLTDGIKSEYLESLAPTRIGRTVAVNLVNPYTNDTNSAVELDVTVGYMLPGIKNKPFLTTIFGGMRQYTDFDSETEQIKMKISQDMDVTLIHGNMLGYIADDSIVL